MTAIFISTSLPADQVQPLRIAFPALCPCRTACAPGRCTLLHRPHGRRDPAAGGQLCRRSDGQLEGAIVGRLPGDRTTARAGILKDGGVDALDPAEEFLERELLFDGA